MPFEHTLTIKKLEETLDTNFASGLTTAQAEKRYKEIGPNDLPREKGHSLFTIFLHQFTSPLVLVLLLSTSILGFLHELVDAGIILFVLLFNAAVGTVQEGRAQSVLAALKKFTTTQATVVRDGAEIILSDSLLVPGDIIILSEGEKIPADARLIHSAGIAVNESSLTGESVPVDKITGVVRMQTHDPSKIPNCVFRGTTVVRGSGRACVIATGSRTEIGKIGTAVSAINEDVPLKREIDTLSRGIVVVALGVGVFMFFGGMLTGRSMIEMFKTIVSLSVSVIPEGLPIVLTIVLAHGVWRMAKHNAVVKKMQAVEALGQASVIAVDKTGTITKNQLLVKKIFANGALYDVSGGGYAPDGTITLAGNPVDPSRHADLRLLAVSALASSNAHTIFSQEAQTWHVSGDPSEAAMIVAAQKLVGKTSFHPPIERIAELPFHYQHKYHAVLARFEKKLYLIVAGAPEVVLAASSSLMEEGKEKTLSSKTQDAIQKKIIELSAQGLRIIAFAFREFDLSRDPSLMREEINNLTFLGWYGMEDALREEVASAVSTARTAGLRVVMMTGDHVLTAQAIARQAGIFRDGDRVLTGDELEQLTAEELAPLLETTSLFARVTPDHKMRIIKGYKQRGDIIAMTGDGVNDAPALMAADLGIALGRIGSDVAKEAADIVLLDDNFSSIVAAIEEGRGIQKKIRRVILYLLGTNLGEVLLICGALILSLPIPLAPAQIIWLNLITDSFLDVSLGMEPSTRNLLTAANAQGRKKIFDRMMIQRIISMSLPTMAGALLIFSSMFERDFTKASTLTLTTIAVAQWFNAWNCRSEKNSIFMMNPFSNPKLLGALGIVISLHLFALYTPLLQSVLHTAPLSFLEWSTCIGLGSLVIITEEVRKYFLRKEQRLLAHPA